MIVLETERLMLRHASLDDAEFLLGLLNEPSFLRFIGDRGVRTVDDAQRYVSERLIGSYDRHGYGLWVVERKETDGPIGLCGLVKRDALPDADIGFAFLPAFWSMGYAHESAAGVMRHARDVLGLERILAVASPDNAPSIRLLEKIGLSFVGPIKLSDDGKELHLLSSEGGSVT